jgi:two-component system, OmpR family, response regulator VicR
MGAHELKQVVYIEDEPELVELLRLILKNESVQVQGALRGQQGLDLIRQLNPDLVVLDLMLPDMEGWDVFWEMQQDPALKNIPVIVVTVRTEGLRDGVWPQVNQLAGYVLKPFTVSELRDIIKRTLGLASE